jgi:5'-3' exonuclease
MGIPSYFSYVLKNHKIIKKLTTIKCNSLFLDANSIIYDVIYENNTVIDNPTIYNNVLNKILSIIDKLKPAFTFIAFDGVVPLAKMKQQKQRRYKSYITKQILKKSSWNTNAITPGTKFMNELDDYLSSRFKEQSKLESYQIIFSGSKESGEGEQKIFEYIRNNVSINNTIIYGLDADLIMLSLLHLSFNENIYLYRETKHFSYIKGIDPQIDYLFSMDEMATQINEILNGDNSESERKSEHEIKSLRKQSIENYCFLCFLCGNDFLPHFPSINIRNNGVQYLLEVYKQIFSQSTIKLVDGKTINWSAFHLLCAEFSTKEVELIHVNIEWKKRMASYSHPLTIEESLDAVALKDLKRELYISNNIDKYYPFLFKNNEKDVCKNYLQMLEWTWYYYNGVCKNNYMCYEFHSGPLFSSLKKYIPCFNEELVEYDTKKLPSSITQLLYVLPYDDYTLIPLRIEYKQFIRLLDKEYINLTETNFPIHFDFCKFFWEGYVDFNYIDLKRLDNTVNKWKL